MTRLARFGFSGALLVAKNHQIILNKAYGWADKENAIPNTVETVFSTGSITKQFTAAAILKLEMQGKLNIGDPISKHLPNVPEDKSAITLHHLLTHTSGIGSDDGGGNMPDREEFISAVLDQPLQSAIGKNFEYTNAGYGLLAAIIEKVSQQTYEQYLRENLFKPAGMNFTGYRIPRWPPAAVAKWYAGEMANGSPFERPFPNWATLGSGEILTTTTDMFKWHLALNGETILSAAAKKKLYTPALRNYAYGWDVMQTPHGTLLAHDGGNTLGVGADLKRFIDAGVVIIAFCNDGGETMLLGETRRNIMKLVFGDEVQMPPAVVTSDSTALVKLLGTYQLPAGARLIVANKNHQLALMGEGQEAMNLLSMSELGNDFSDLNMRVTNIIAASAKGDYSLIHAAYQGEVPLEMIKTRQSKQWQEWRDRLGNYKNCEVLGTAPEGEEDKFTYSRLNFERGHVFLRFYWGPMRLAGIRPIPALAGKMFLSQNVTAFVAFDVPTAKTMHLRFNLDNKGAVTGLRLTGNNREVAANKIP